MSEYELDTAVVPAREGRFTGTVADRWGFGSIPNAGYVACLAVRAPAEVMPHPDPEGG